MGVTDYKLSINFGIPATACDIWRDQSVKVGSIGGGADTTVIVVGDTMDVKVSVNFNTALGASYYASIIILSKAAIKLYYWTHYP